MATVLLSKLRNTFYGVCMSGHSGSVTSRSVHPASPSHAYQEWPTNDAAFVMESPIKRPPVPPIQSLRIDEGHYAPTSLIIRFTGWNCVILRRRYPKGNFGRNQLPGSSISLSPPYPDLTINLHVRTAASLHQGFP